MSYDINLLGTNHTTNPQHGMRLLLLGPHSVLAQSSNPSKPFTSTLVSGNTQLDWHETTVAIPPTTGTMSIFVRVAANSANILGWYWLNAAKTPVTVKDFDVDIDDGPEYAREPVGHPELSPEADEPNPPPERGVSGEPFSAPPDESGALCMHWMLSNRLEPFEAAKEKRKITNLEFQYYQTPRPAPSQRVGEKLAQGSPPPIELFRATQVAVGKGHSGELPGGATVKLGRHGYAIYLLKFDDRLGPVNPDQYVIAVMSGLEWEADGEQGGPYRFVHQCVVPGSGPTF